MDIRHPWLYLQQELTKRWRTQKGFAQIIGKSTSEVNELIKGKRNITAQRDVLLAAIFDSPPKKRMSLQMEYEYEIGRQHIDEKKIEDIKNRKKDVEGLRPVEASPVESWPRDAVVEDGGLPEADVVQEEELAEQETQQEPEVNTVASPEESTTITDTKAIEPPKSKHKEHEIFRNF